jgi:glucose/arabinose dehydrogenase
LSLRIVSLIRFLVLLGIIIQLQYTISDYEFLPAFSPQGQNPALTSTGQDSNNNNNDDDDFENEDIEDSDDNTDESNRVPLTIEHVVTSNTSERFLGPNMAFLDINDILVLEDVKGKVWRVVNGQISDEPLLDLNAYTPDGLTGIAISKFQNGTTYVFLYLNEAPAKHAKDVSSFEEAEILNKTLGYDREGNRLYRYELVDNRLVNPKLLFQIPDKTRNIFQEIHHGGEVVVGPDSRVYVAIGDIDGHEHPASRTLAQNYQNGTNPDGRAGIIRIAPDGQVVNGEGILGNEDPLVYYYAYGIRNSFGLDFDPVTGNLWDTENGPNYGDEINLLEPGSNSGWRKVQGFWEPQGEDRGKENLDPDDLVDFDRQGKYAPPQFVWNFTVAPTALKFFDSDKFGEEYENDMFVGDINNGNLYHFDLSDDRTELTLSDPLDDKVADERDELEDIIFAEGFNGIADVQVGPDGYLYILSNGSIYRIRPAAVS